MLQGWLCLYPLPPGQADHAMRVAAATFFKSLNQVRIPPASNLSTLFLPLCTQGYLPLFPLALSTCISGFRKGRPNDYHCLSCSFHGSARIAGSSSWGRRTGPGTVAAACHFPLSVPTLGLVGNNTWGGTKWRGGNCPLLLSPTKLYSPSHSSLQRWLEQGRSSFGQ